MSTFQLGVIEGFYGRDWCDSKRLELLPWLQARQYQNYIYAPKSEHFLRSQWDQPLPEESQQRLRDIQRVASANDLNWGVGFSPLGAVQCFDQVAQQKMSAKLASLEPFGFGILAVLFDDMHCASADLAARQCEIVEFIRQRMPDQQIIMCPTYYSYDPVLERVFGAMPPAYWQQLGDGLAAEVDVFWTGNKVCSESIHLSDVIEITEALQRPLTLWDNYPVNDGARASLFLRLDSFDNRDWRLSTQLRGHYSNPMNQCFLSKVALASLPLLYQRQSDYDAAAEFHRLCKQEFGAAVGGQLIDNKHDFTKVGLKGLSVANTEALLKAYQRFDHPVASEVCDWLSGQYEFDPACLTETGP